MKISFFEWVFLCTKELGWDPKDGYKMLPAEDISWFNCYDDGLTPKEAVAEAISKGVVKKNVQNASSQEAPATNT